VKRRFAQSVIGMGDISEIETALDERRAAARAAFFLRDIAAYADISSDDLEYIQTDGIVIGRSSLMRSVGTQFKRLIRADSSFNREEIEISDGEVSETVSQTASAEASAFGLIHRTWRLLRRGRYTWRNTDGVWKIARVHVLSEEVLSDGWRFGL